MDVKKEFERNQKKYNRRFKMKPIIRILIMHDYKAPFEIYQTSSISKGQRTLQLNIPSE